MQPDSRALVNRPSNIPDARTPRGTANETTVHVVCNKRVDVLDWISHTRLRCLIAARHANKESEVRDSRPLLLSCAPLSARGGSRAVV